MRSEKQVAADVAPTQHPQALVSDYLIQILHTPTGEVVQWRPGQLIERFFIQELLDRIAAKGVGFGRTTKHVTADVHAAISEMLHEMKKQV